jgi:hypothetical protein
METLNALLENIKSNPETVSFKEVIDAVDANYAFTPTGFKNGYTFNEADTNNGSCKVFSFAQLHQLSANETLNLFGDYYRVDVLENPDNDDHQNIRNFIKFGWGGITFEGSPLT